jgi:lipopolysaccharide transport system ATP-binding protein
MSDFAIRVEGLGKEYHIGGEQKTYTRLGDQVWDVVTTPFRRAGKLLRGQATGAAELDETFWALNDVSFEIKQGEVVGIIGRNGAGKSTLLKVLSRITEPTSGYADVYGRVGSLLEVGTGFHPELTGRENVFLNGAILGMKRTEIERKFDEIVAFAEIAKFIDTPVKHYSSGMYVRLAFSVAAHLEPEILLVDEVLAVGDIAFQRKCLGKMDDVAQQGRTVLFVSHNMGLMQTLCQRGIFLKSGQVAEDGTIITAVDSYLQGLAVAETEALATRTDRRGKGKVKVVRAEIQTPGALKFGVPADFVVEVDKGIAGISCNIMIHDSLGQAICNFESKYSSPADISDPNSSTRFVCCVPELLLRPGRYRMDATIIGDNVMQDFIEAALIFDVGEGQLGGRTMPAHKKFRMTMPHRWSLPTRI